MALKDVTAYDNNNILAVSRNRELMNRELMGVRCIWKNKRLNLQVKIRLYESLVLSTLQYGAETWPMTVVNSKKLEAAHHKWLRRILGITWKQKVTNEEVRKRTGMGNLLNMLRRNRLRWLGHVHRMITHTHKLHGLNARWCQLLGALVSSKLLGWETRNREV